MTENLTDAFPFVLFQYLPDNISAEIKWTVINSLISTGLDSVFPLQMYHVETPPFFSPLLISHGHVTGFLREIYEISPKSVNFP